MDQDKKALRSLIITFTLLLLFIIYHDWAYRLFVNHINDNALIANVSHAIFNKFKHLLFLLKVGLTVFLILFAFFTKRTKEKPSKNHKTVIASMSILLTLIFYAGYLQFPTYYVVFIYPFVVLLFTILTVIAASIFLIKPIDWSNDLSDIVGLNTKAKEGISFTLKTHDQKDLVILNPRQGILVVGGAGSGKSASVLVPIIYELPRQNFCGVIYDYEGDPSEKEGAILTKHTINAISKYPKSKINFAFINFVSLHLSEQCNPLALRYFLDKNGRLDKTAVMEIGVVIMMNLNKEGAQKKDFWFDNTVSMMQGVIWRLLKIAHETNDDKYCTLPHTICLMLGEIDALLNWLIQDEETKLMIAPIYGAFKRDAQQQLAGVESSYQLQINKLLMPDIFWVLCKDDLDLDITNPKNRTLLCVGNSPSKQNALQAPISTILNTNKRLMNMLGKVPSVFMLDEAPTVYIDKIDNLPAVARKKGVCTIVGVQTVEQLSRDYGKENANVLVQNLGNIFCGGNSDERYSKSLETLIGKYDKKDSNFSETDSGAITNSYNTKKEEVITAAKIMQQEAGEFTGKIFSGKPPLFSTKLSYIEDTEGAQVPLVKNSPLNDQAILSLKNPAERDAARSKIINENYIRIMNEASRILETAASNVTQHN